MAHSGRGLRVILGMPFAERLGGAERLLDDLVRRSAEIDVEPHVVFFEDGPWESELRQTGVPVTVVEPGRFRRPDRNLRAAVALRQLFRRERPDVIVGWIARGHVTLAPPAVAAGMADRLVWCQHHVPSGEFIERAATLMPARLVVANSAAAEAAQRAAWPRRRTRLVYPGIDPPSRRPDEAARLRAALGIPVERTVIGVSGRLVRWKGQDRVLEAVAALASERHDVHVLVVGGSGQRLDLGYEPELHALVRRSGLAERATFTGHVDDPLLYTEIMDVAVNASDPEPFGMALLEAMGLERPVVAVATGGPAEVIEHERSGLLVDSAEPATLKRALAKLVSDPQRRARMGRAGRELVLQRFTLDRWLSGLRFALESVAPGDRRRSEPA